jgi:aquaglyceroporin related protein
MRSEASYQTRQTTRQNPTNRPSRAQHPNLHNALPKRPQYSLAGNPTSAHGPTYIDPRYLELNPSYEYRKAENAPVWGLAKPLPRVVRAGMRRGKNGEVVEDKDAERQEPGSAEAIPQVGMIDDQKQEAGKGNRAAAPDIELRGYGNEGVERRRSDVTAQRVMSENSVVDRFGTPEVERSNPLEEWRSRGHSTRSRSDPFDNQNADLGDRRLSRVPEVRSQAPSASSSVSAIGHQNEIDLEAGENIDEWALEEEEAERYAQEAYDDHNLWSSIRAKFREPLAECLAVSSTFNNNHV